MIAPLATTRWGRIKAAASVAPFELPIVTYLAVVGAGAILSGAESTPSTLDDALPGWMVVMWAVCLTVGGGCTAFGLLRHSPHLESLGLIVLAWPCGMYAAVLALVAAPAGIAAALAYLALLTGCILRLRVLFLADRARRLANVMLREGSA
ncbi:MAG TPA: hypothetical protein VF642_12215 [Propionibacteriaceae bacterium]